MKKKCYIIPYSEHRGLRTSLICSSTPGMGEGGTGTPGTDAGPGSQGFTPGVGNPGIEPDARKRQTVLDL